MEETLKKYLRLLKLNDGMKELKTILKVLKLDIQYFQNAIEKEMITALTQLIRSNETRYRLKSDIYPYRLRHLTLLCTDIFECFPKQKNNSGNMIIVRLIGGLGNQMFQYAAGRCLAYKYRTELKLDTRDFKNYTLRNYDLNNFDIIENFATSSDLSRILFPSNKLAVKVFEHVMRSVSRVESVEYIKEKKYNFQQNFLKLPDNIYLDGYWQSEKYFLDIENIIRKEFSVVNSLTSTSQDLVGRIQNCEAVSLHVRRGDYVSDPKTNSVHGVCGIEYYCNAIDIISKNVETPCFFVFSDDPDWACHNIKPNAPTVYVRHENNSKDYEDMYLMSVCKHNIIANSSFSWWGAWLNKNPEKIVIAPKKWFNSKDMDTCDLLPDKWYKI